MSRSAQRLALLAPLALLVFAGCSSTPLRHSTTEFVNRSWEDDGHAIVNPLAVTTNRQPDYPIALRRNAVEGQVNVDCVVDATGRVLLASIASSTNQGFNDCSLAAVRSWTFEPATRDGVPVAMGVRLPLYYVMER